MPNTKHNNVRPFSLVPKTEDHEANALSQNEALAKLPSVKTDRSVHDLVSRPQTTLAKWAAEGREARALAQETSEARINVGKQLIESHRQQACAAIAVEFHNRIKEFEQEVIVSDAKRLDFINEFYVERIKAKIVSAGDEMKSIEQRLEAGEITDEQANELASEVQQELERDREDWGRRLEGLRDRYFNEFNDQSITTFKKE